MGTTYDLHSTSGVLGLIIALGATMTSMPGMQHGLNFFLSLTLTLQICEAVHGEVSQKWDQANSSV